MGFKTLEFLNDYGISYTEKDSIVSSGYVGLNCCFCNDHAKPYMGIKIDTGYVTCWRCGSHTLLDTIEALTGFSSKSELFNILNKYKGSSFGNYSNLTDNTQSRKIPSKLILPGKPEMIKQTEKYLIKRNFDPVYLYEKYKLRSTTYDNPSYRIVFPFLYNGKAVSWTARDWSGKSDLRYISCPADKELVNHKDILYNWDNQKKNGNVLLVEGILDAVRTGGIATAGTSVTMAQLLLLKQFKRVFIMFDGSATAIKKAYEIAVILSSVGIDNEVIELEEGEDPDTAFMRQVDLVALKKDLQLY